MVAPLVSIVIPCFNAEKHVSDAIRSAFSQDVERLEVIVVDDGSVDRTVEVAESFGSGIKILRQSNQGAASARNAGIQESRGQFVAFLDSDDWWHPRKLSTQLAHLQACAKCGAVFATWLEACSPTDPSWTALLAADLANSHLELAAEHSGWLYSELLLDSVIHTSSILIRRSIVDQIGLFDVGLLRGQDLDYWLRMSRVTEIHKLRATLSAYRLYEGSATTRPTSANYRALVIEQALSRWGLSDPSGRAAKLQDVHKILAASWSQFGYMHFRKGSPKIAFESFRRAQSYGIGSARLSTLKLAASFKSLISRAPDDLDPRHSLNAG